MFNLRCLLDVETQVPGAERVAFGYRSLNMNRKFGSVDASLEVDPREGPRSNFFSEFDSLFGLFMNQSSFLF